MAPESWESTLGRISAAAARSGRVELLTGSGLSLRAITAILRRKAKPTERTVARLLNAIPALEAAEEEKRKPMATILELARQEAQRNGLRQLAGKLGTDPANLAKVLAGKRKLSKALLQALEGLLSSLDFEPSGRALSSANRPWK